MFDCVIIRLIIGRDIPALRKGRGYIPLSLLVTCERWGVLTYLAAPQFQ